MKNLLPTLVFLILNFAALAVGGLFTGSGVSSEWYQNLDKAPWTPPGWVFGAAWTFIMICFAFYMGKLWTNGAKHKSLVVRLYGVQWLLNVAWNPVFFLFSERRHGAIGHRGALLECAFACHQVQPHSKSLDARYCSVLVMVDHRY